MAFQKEHDLADEYYNYKGDDVGFTHLVRLDAIYYCFILKKDNIFNAVYKLVIFKRIFDEVKLTAEGWLLFKYVIEKAPLGQAMILNLLFTRRKKNIKMLF